MAQLTGFASAFPQPLYSSSATAGCPPGTRAMTADGREFVYVLNGITATVAGKLYQTAAELTNHDNLTPTAATAIGDLTITVTLGNTAVTANQYAGGTLAIDTTPGQGYTYLITSHPAALGNATCVFTIEQPGFIVATDTNSRVTLVPNPYSAVVVTPATTLTGAPVGVATYIIAASEYGWIQTWGPCSVLIDGAIATGACVTAPSSVIGAVLADPANAAVSIVGRMLVAGATTEYNQVFLTL